MSGPALAGVFFSMTYQDYLSTLQWQRRRWGCFRRAAMKCESCGARPEQAHHLTYERLFNELDSDLMALCEDCHQRAEAFIATGQILRKGDTKTLRWQTRSLLSPSNNSGFGKINPKACKTLSSHSNTIRDFEARSRCFKEKLILVRENLARQRESNIRLKREAKAARKRLRKNLVKLTGS